MVAHETRDIVAFRGTLSKEAHKIGDHFSVEAREFQRASFRDVVAVTEPPFDGGACTAWDGET